MKARLEAFDANFANRKIGPSHEFFVSLGKLDFHKPLEGSDFDLRPSRTDGENRTKIGMESDQNRTISGPKSDRNRTGL